MLLNRKKYKIVVLDDSEFYNDLLTRQLKYFTNDLSLVNDCAFEITSYTSPRDCLTNMGTDTDLAFFDYYLGGGVTASDLMAKVKATSKNCKVVIMSQVRSTKTALQSVAQGALDFVYKDKNSLPRSCFIVEDLVHGQFNV